jgi:hypothetical protein
LLRNKILTKGSANQNYFNKVLYRTPANPQQLITDSNSLFSISSLEKAKAVISGYNHILGYKNRDKHNQNQDQNFLTS